MKALSNLAQSVRASTTLAIDTQFNKMRSEGIDVIGFSVGQPDFPTPEHIKQAGIRAIQENRLGPGLHPGGDRRQRRRQAHPLCRPQDPHRPRRRGDPARPLLGELL